MLTHGSLFSGIGGFDLAAEWMGWHNTFHCEINEFCTRILNYHFPNAEHYTDITKTDFSKYRGRIDVLSGGFPCQPFSVAGKRKGTDDDRYLWPQMLRAIREIRPTWIIGENVGEIVTMVQPGKTVELGSSTSLFGEDYKDEEIHQRYVVETICTDLEREGYSVQPILIPACAIGAPHRRDRVWFIANRTDTGAESMQQAGQNSIHAVGFASNTCCIRRTGRRSKGYREEDKKSVRAGIFRKIEGFVGKQPVTHTKSQQGERYKSEQPTDCATKQREFGRICCKNHSGHTIRGWENFPTQSPVCSRNDGVSTRLDGITFPKWREESVKAYGNAIVPQVAYEIFKAIQETYNQ